MEAWRHENTSTVHSGDAKKAAAWQQTADRQLAVDGDSPSRRNVHVLIGLIGLCQR